jgi:hypothetical protein
MKVKRVCSVLLLSAAVSLHSFSQSGFGHLTHVAGMNLSPAGMRQQEYSFRGAVNEDSFWDKENNENELKDSTVIYSYNSSTDSLPVFKSTYEYDESGNNTVYYSYNWDASNNIWDLSRKIEYGYDDQANHILTLYYNRDETTGSWEPTNKTEHTYDTEGNHIRYIKYRWDTDSTDWIYTEKSEILSSPVDTIIRSGYSIWDTINYEWIERSRQISISTKDDLVMLRIDSVRDINTGTWILQTTEVYEYTAEGLLTSEERYSWVSDGSDSSGIFKYTYEYDEDARVTLQTFLDWDDENDNWFPEVQQFYSYNVTGQLVEVVRNILNETGDDWIAYQRWELSYGDFIDIEAAYLWVQETAAFEVFSKTFTCFRHEPVSIDPDANIDFTVAPNPFNESIRISGSSHIRRISIYTLQGLLLVSREYTGEPIHLAGLPDGVYMVRVQNDVAVSDSRLILKK